MRFWGTVVFGAALVSAGLAYYVRERSQATGQSYTEVVRQLPAEARRGYGEARERTRLAVGDGLRAARSREHQVERALLAVAPRDGDHPTL